MLSAFNYLNCYWLRYGRVTFDFQLDISVPKAFEIKMGEKVANIVWLPDTERSLLKMYVDNVVYEKEWDEKNALGLYTFAFNDNRQIVMCKSPENKQTLENVIGALTLGYYHSNKYNFLDDVLMPQPKRVKVTHPE